MTFTYDTTTDIGKVRLTLPDKVQTEALFTDEEIQVFLDIEGGDWRLATAFALETMAGDEVLVFRSIRVQDLEITGSDRAAKALLDRAKLLRMQAETMEADDTFEIVELGYNDFATRELWSNIILREG
jgi:hypothetical protein